MYNYISIYIIIYIKYYIYTYIYMCVCVCVCESYIVSTLSLNNCTLYRPNVIMGTDLIIFYTQHILCRPGLTISFWLLYIMSSIFIITQNVYYEDFLIFVFYILRLSNLIYYNLHIKNVMVIYHFMQFNAHEEIHKKIWTNNL